MTQFEQAKEEILSSAEIPKDEINKKYNQIKINI